MPKKTYQIIASNDQIGLTEMKMEVEADRLMYNSDVVLIQRDDGSSLVTVGIFPLQSIVGIIETSAKKGVRFLAPEARLMTPEKKKMIEESFKGVD